MTVTCKLGEKGCWNDGKCRATSNCENKVVTNADRIRAMSGDELAAFINKIVVCHGLKNAYYCNKCPIFGAKPCDTEGIEDWLQQPANDGGTLDK